MDSKPDLTILRKRYPQKFPIPPDKLNEEKLLLILERELMDWKIVSSPLPENPAQNRLELFREYIFKTFDQVLEFMLKVAPICNTLPHHPRWENTWTTLKVYSSTWDSGHILTYKDIMLARHMERLYKDYGETYVNLHVSKRIERGMKEFISGIESLKKNNLSEAFKTLSQYLSQPQDINEKNKIETVINDYNQFIHKVVQKELSENEIRDRKIYFESQLTTLINSLKYSRPKVFFSYAWGQQQVTVVDQLYDSLKADGEYEVVRDKFDLQYKGLISEFMKTIGTGSFVIIALSERYLRSEYCMFELCELYRNSRLENEELLKKIYPIRVEKLDLDDLDVLKNLTDYWEDQQRKVEKLVTKFPDRYQKIKTINNEFGSLVGFLRDINASNVELLKNEDFAEIKKAINKRVLELK